MAGSSFRTCTRKGDFSHQGPWGIHGDHRAGLQVGPGQEAECPRGSPWWARTGSLGLWGDGVGGHFVTAESSRHCHSQHGQGHQEQGQPGQEVRTFQQLTQHPGPEAHWWRTWHPLAHSCCLFMSCPVRHAGRVSMVGRGSGPPWGRWGAGQLVMSLGPL